MYPYATSTQNVSALSDLLRAFFDFFLHPGEGGLWTVIRFSVNVLVGALALAAIVAVVALIYTRIRLMEHAHMVKKRTADAKEKAIAASRVSNKKWERVKDHISSDNEANWRLAILEADVMLEELLDSRGYIGQTVADKLKAVNRGDFKSIDAAWEAHKIRNTIAHEGGDFQIPLREAKRVVGLFEQVFTEFQFI